MTDDTQELEVRIDKRDEDELLQHLVVYMSFYVEARDAKSVEDMGKWMHKILSMITGAYSDGFKKAAKGAFKSQQAAKREAVEAVLDKFEQDCKLNYTTWGNSERMLQVSGVLKRIEAERARLKEAK